MRVALVCPYSLSRPGGVQGQVVGLGRALEGAGHDVLVVAPDDEHPLGLHPANGGPGRFVAGRSTGVRANGSVAPVALDPRAAWRARQAVRRFGADVVHLHEPFAPAVGYALLAEHRVAAVGTYHRAGEGSGYRLVAPLARWADGRLDVRCAVSEAAAATVAAVVGARPVEVLFNGVEVDRYAHAAPVASAVPAILFLGRHERRKGLAVLLEAYQRAKWPDEAVRPPLWVAGDGPETAGLRQRFAGVPGIEWLGVLPDADVPRRLAGAAVLCAPALGGESFGMVLLEAMAAGCAVVASDIPGYRAAADGHATLVPPDDPEALAAALVSVIPGRHGTDAPPDGAASALDAARHHAEEWSMAHLAERYVDLYRRAMREHSVR